MDFLDYLGGAHANAYVPDLVLQGAGAVELVFILESPHSDELVARHPVAGATGRSALAFLRSQPVGTDSLGEVVKKNHSARDPRVAILNIATVPLQEKAFIHSNQTAPTMNDWGLLAAIRKSKAQTVDRTPRALANQAGSALLSDLQTRIDALPKSPDTAIVTCGRFAGRFGRALSGLLAGQVLEVRHPSYQRWQRSTGVHAARLDKVRELFLARI